MLIPCYRSLRNVEPIGRKIPRKTKTFEHQYTKASDSVKNKTLAHEIPSNELAVASEHEVSEHLCQEFSRGKKYGAKLQWTYRKQLYGLVHEHSKCNTSRHLYLLPCICSQS